MRQKEFNRNSVLEKCIILFWKEGFNGSGIEKVVDITGVNRYSLYQEFGNKKGILIASLQLYSERHVPVDLLVNSSTIKETVYQFLFSFFQPKNSNQHPVGCYITSIGMELREDEELQKFVNEYIETLKSNFSKLIGIFPLVDEIALATVVKQLTYFYFSCMSMCVILSREESDKYIKDNLSLITKCLEE